MRTVKVFAASIGKRMELAGENFGDALMPLLLREIFNLEAVYTHPAQADLIGVGSILDAYYRRRKEVSIWRKRPWRTLHVWGSGFMDSRSEVVWPQRLRYCAVRGPLTRERVGHPELCMGDPAILLPLIFPKPADSIANVLIIPHFATYTAFQAQYGHILPKHWKVVDLRADIREICVQIAGADFVLSSSLHGLIVAAAYGVPCLRMHPHGHIKGDGFKFADYFSYIQRDAAEPVNFEDCLSNPTKWLSPPPPARPLNSPHDLIDAFPFK